MFVRFLPGFFAAMAAYMARKQIGWVRQSQSFKIVLFFGIYAAVTVIVDAAMKKYGEQKT